jgi:membrane fusion protein (multidrug efflux system)
VAVAFSRTLRSIEADGFGRSKGTIAVVTLLGAVWGMWFVFARVTVVEVSDRARLEVDRAAHSVEAPVSGRITATHLDLGAEVKQGDSLVEIDSEALHLARNEESARLQAVVEQIRALEDEVASEEIALRDQRRVAQTKIDEARARLKEVQSAAEYSEQEAARVARLHESGLASEAEKQKLKADAEQRRAVADGAQLVIGRIESEQRAAETERRARLSRLRGEVATLGGQKAMSTVSLDRLKHDIELRSVRAPVAGRIGEIAPVRAGAFVKEGDRLGAVVPTGDVRIVAEYQPSSAVGRIRPGQRARMRPDGFPWTQYGSLNAVVSRVASEPRSNQIRVELAVSPNAASGIPLQHGLPGMLEVEVDRISPALLVLRAAGREVAAPAQSTDTNPADSRRDRDRVETPTSARP